MKKIGLLSLFSILAVGLSAQSIDNINRFSTTELTGSPRYIGMGGAFTALGNDLSSLHLNPAGGSVYRNSNFAFSLGLQSTNADADFLKANQSYSTIDLGLQNIGVVKKFGRNKEWFFSASYNTLANFNRSYTLNAENTYSNDMGLETGFTLGEYWLDGAYGLSANELATNGYLEEASAINTVLLPDSNNRAVIYDYYVNPSSTLSHYVEESGSRGEMLLNIGGQINEFLALGVGLGFTGLDFVQNTTLTESGYADSSYIVNSILNKGNSIDASGLNLKLGLILRPNQVVRIGLSYETPTWWYKVNEVQSISVDALAYDNTLYQGTEYIANDIAYRLTTPSILRAGVGFVLGKHAIVSTGYSFSNSKNISLSERDGYDYTSFQEDWEFVATTAHTINAGLELRYGPAYLRGGYVYQTTHFKQLYPMESERNTASFGLGYKSGRIGVDFGYNLSQYTQQTFTHTALSYAVVNGTPIENYNVDRAIVEHEIRKGTFVVGMNISF